MGAFTLSQVPGWEMLASAARLVDLPLVIAAPAGGAPCAADGYGWGDPEALRDAADEWARIGQRVADMCGPSGDISTTAAAVRDTWTGVAAERHAALEQRLETSFEQIGAQAVDVAGLLYELADELDRTIRRQTARVLRAVAAITAPLATWTVNGAAPPIVLNALMRLLRELEREAREQHAKGREHAAAMRALFDDERDGGAGPRRPLLTIAADTEGAWAGLAGAEGQG